MNKVVAEIFSISRVISAIFILSLCPARATETSIVLVSATDSIGIDPYRPKIFYFPINQSLLMKDYEDNAQMLSALDSLFRIPSVVNNIDTIEIKAGCSPVASEEYNKKLAHKRALAVRSYIRWKYLKIAESHPIKLMPVGIDWDGYNALKNSGRGLNEKRMQDLTQYASIRLRLKDGSYIHEGADSPLKALMDLEKKKQSTDTMYVYRVLRDTVYIKGNVEISKPRTSFSMGIKTNLLYDLALLPNLAIEFALGKDWSVAVYGAWSWWSAGHPRYWHHRIQWAGVEVRRWWGNRYRMPLNGHHAGLYLSGGNYDLRLFTKDHEGRGELSLWSWSAGMSYGYSLPIAKRWDLNFGLKAGYFTGVYRKYNRANCNGCHDPVKRSGKSKRNYLGPTGAIVSLIYKIGRAEQ